MGDQQKIKTIKGFRMSKRRPSRGGGRCELSGEVLRGLRDGQNFAVERELELGYGITITTSELGMWSLLA